MSLSSLRLKLAQFHCIRIALSHYENFFVLGPLTPPRFIPHMAALYAFSRHADDLADEDTESGEALEKLNAWQQELQHGLEGHPHHPITKACSFTVTRFHLPPELLFDLIAAFKRDLSVTNFETFAHVRDYTRRSADPVGRLVLRLYGYQDPELDALSDQICTGLQLANFCQDVGEDARKGRIYIPLDECRRFEVDPVEILDCTPSPRLEGLLRFQIVRAYKHLIAGMPLAERLKGRLKMSVRLFVLGGLQILESLEREPLTALYRRLKLNSWQKMSALISSLRPLKDQSATNQSHQVQPTSSGEKLR